MFKRIHNHFIKKSARRHFAFADLYRNGWFLSGKVLKRDIPTVIQMAMLYGLIQISVGDEVAKHILEVNDEFWETMVASDVGLKEAIETFSSVCTEAGEFSYQHHADSLAS